MGDIENQIQDQISRSISVVQERIRDAAIKVGRDPAGIDLVAVTKKKNALVIKTLVENGITKIGESYLQEAIFKVDLLKDLPAEWHMIGPIQNGKEKNVARYFTVVHSIDRVDLARQLNSAAERLNKKIIGYLEFNVSGESSKYGWNAWDSSRWEDLLPEVEEVLSQSALKIIGLMTMAPYSSDPESSRPYFRKLSNLRTYLTSKFPAANLDGLSMGMSGDYQVAVEEGATMLRIGTALVGSRS